MIIFDNVHFRRDERDILRNIQLHIKENEHWVILGRNGSGKTTILEMMNGYLFPSSGQIHVLGNEYGKCDIREVRKRIGYISQSLLEKLALKDPVWEVVATGEYGYLRFYEAVPEQLKEKAIEMLKKVHLEHTAHLPLGLLSQGERKKVMLARSLMTSPDLLIMDEPCSGLDLYEREKLLDDLEGFRNQGIQFIYVTHHLEEIIPLFTHVALIHEGQIIAQGDKRDVIREEQIMQAYEVKVDIDWIGERPWLHVI